MRFFHFIKAIGFLLKKYRELIAYGIVGLLSVADNLFWFWLFLSVLKLPYMAANALGWLVDVWISFLMNKYLVFESKSKGSFLREAASFISARFGSGLLDMLIFYVLVKFFMMDIRLSKGIDVVVIIAVNYAASKFWVFRHKR